MKKFLVLISVFICFGFYAKSQNNNLGIGTGTPDSSAMLEILSNNKGLLVPRMTAIERLAIPSPANALMVYDTDSACFFYYIQPTTTWVNLCSALAESDPKVGTLSTNKVPKWNGVELTDGLISDDGSLVTISSDAKINNLTIGKGKGGETTNTALGYATLYSDSSSVRNTAVGFEVLFANISSSYNTAVGFRSQYLTNTGNGGNTSMGYFSLSKNLTGYYNTSAGGWSMRDNIDGYRNTAFGYGALYGNAHGFENTAIGTSADVLSDSLNNATAIGANAKVGQSNALVLGNNADVGIGTSTPSAKLDVEGTFQLKDGTEGSNLILTSDSSGNASWQNLSIDAILDSVPTTSYSNVVCSDIISSLGIGSSPTSVVKQGNYAYVVDSDSADLKIIDITDPTLPSQTGSLYIGSNPRAVVVQGNYAYVVDSGSDDLKIIDITNPASPSLSGSLPMGTSPVSVAVQNNYAYVVDSDIRDLKIIDVSIPSTPSLTYTQSLTGIGIPTGVEVQGNYAYVVGGPNISSPGNLISYDISNPASPLFTNSVSLGTLGPGPRKLALSGNRAYIIDLGFNSFEIINISNPASLSSFGSITISPDPVALDVNGNYAYVVDAGSDVLKFIDVSNPSAPFVRESLSIGGNPTSISIDGNFAYVVDADSDDLKIIKLFCENQSAVTINAQTGGLTFQDMLWLKDTTSEDIFNANDGNVGIGISDPDYLLHVNGTAGKPGGGSWTVASDSRLKKDINEFTDGLDLINKIEPKTFKYNGVAGITTKEEFVGIIAQDMQKIAPYMISEFESKDRKKYLAFDPSALDFVFVNAIKQQQNEIDEQRKVIDELHEKIEALNAENAVQNEILNANIVLMKQLEELLKMQAKK